MNCTTTHIRLLALCLPLLAVSAQASDPPVPAALRKMKNTYILVGLTVKNTQGQKLGTVGDLALDLENGRIVEVIVESGGFLGFGRRTVAVPPGACTYDAEEEVLRLHNVSEEKYKAAPDFAMSKWAEHCESGRVAAVYRYYGQVPYFAVDGQDSKSGNTATEPLGYVQRVTKLRDLPVKNLQEESLGYVGGFLFGPLGGRTGIAHVIVKEPGFLRTKSIIAPTALRFNAARDALYLDLSVTAFRNEPRFKWTYASGDSLEWAAGTNPSLYRNRNSFFRTGTYKNREVAANGGTNTRQNVREGVVSTYTPLEQGDSFADREMASRIQTAMQADASLSRNARNVEVGVLNGRTTLRGHVNTEEGKRAIGRIAAEAGAPENVSNLLEIRAVPPTQ